MEIRINERPSMLPAAPALLPAACRAEAASPARLAVGDWPLTRAHQVQVQFQAELARVLVPAGGYGIGGFAGVDAMTSKKRINLRGVPPRGKPV